MNYLTKKYSVDYLDYRCIEHNLRIVIIQYYNDIELIEEITKIERMSSFKCWDNIFYIVTGLVSNLDIVIEFKNYMNKKKVLDNLHSL